MSGWINSPLQPPVLSWQHGKAVTTANRCCCYMAARELDSMQTTIAPMLPKFRCISFDQRGVGESVCRDGRYELPAYLDDVEAICNRAGIARWHVLGHSWGGLIAQAYTAAYPQRARSLVLSSSSLGAGPDWKRTKREAFRTNRTRAGLWGTARFFAYGSGLAAPGPIGAWSMRHVMTETWHNYFLDPGSAPDPDPRWLAGCSAKAMIKSGPRRSCCM
jgi:pimeloyl-ACP methyl ester carboxylesterase